MAEHRRRAKRRKLRLPTFRPAMEPMRKWERDIILADIASFDGEYVTVWDLDRKFPGRYNIKHLSSALRAMSLGHYGGREREHCPRVLDAGKVAHYRFGRRRPRHSYKIAGEYVVTGGSVYVKAA